MCDANRPLFGPIGIKSLLVLIFYPNKKLPLQLLKPKAAVLFLICLLLFLVFYLVDEIYKGVVRIKLYSFYRGIINKSVKSKGEGNYSAV